MQSLVERVYPASLRMHSNSSQKKPAKYETTSRGKVSKRTLVAFSKENNLEAKKRPSCVRKRLTIIKSQYSARHLS